MSLLKYQEEQEEQQERILVHHAHLELEQTARMGVFPILLGKDY